MNGSNTIQFHFHFYHRSLLHICYHWNIICVCSLVYSRSLNQPTFSFHFYTLLSFLEFYFHFITDHYHRPIFLSLSSLHQLVVLALFSFPELSCPIFSTSLSSSFPSSTLTSHPAMFLRPVFLDIPSFLSSATHTRIYTRSHATHTQTMTPPIRGCAVNLFDILLSFA